MGPRREDNFTDRTGPKAKRATTPLTLPYPPFTPHPHTCPHLSFCPASRVTGEVLSILLFAMPCPALHTLSPTIHPRSSMPLHQSQGLEGGLRGSWTGLLQPPGGCRGGQGGQEEGSCLFSLPRRTHGFCPASLDGEETDFLIIPWSTTVHLLHLDEVGVFFLFLFFFNHFATFSW